MLIDPAAFEACFTAWVGAVATPSEREVIAIDGKTVRGSFDRGREQSPLHRVSAWASEQGVVLGQRCVDEKSNEITAIPELLESLTLENTLVTLDAMGCQKEIAQCIVDHKADYLLVLKANHDHDYAAVQKHFEQHCFGRGATAKPVFDAFDESHGRRVRRRVFASPQAALLETLGDWPQLHTVLAVEAIRGVNGSGKVQAEIRYFLSSFTGDEQVLAQVIRRHGSIENNLHWVLDVTFREDGSRVRDPTAVRNFALLCKIAINRVGQDRSTKTSIRGKRKKVAWDNDYMLQLLQTNFMR